MSSATITFCGGAGSVTGSNFLLDTGAPSTGLGAGKKFLIDCGMFQGGAELEAGNWAPFGFDPTEIALLVNTHAHIDHIGRIPHLVRLGYRGPILSTEATRAIAEPLLHDAMELSRMDAKRHGHPELFGEADIAQALSQWQTMGYHAPKDLGDGVTLEFLDSGHILGSAMALFRRTSEGEVRSVLFTGDLGGGNSPLLSLAEEPKDVNYLVTESVYGDKMPAPGEPRLDQLENHIEDVARRGGVLLIPAFSTERTQDILFEIRELFTNKKVPSMPVYLDSPLAEKITQAYVAHPEFFNEAMQARIHAGEKIFAFDELHFIENAAQSTDIMKKPGPKIILAGSGMSNGGRVLAHEMEVLPDEHSTVLIAGYQAAGSLGRQLIEGAKKLDIHGTSVAVRAKIETIYGYSAHMNSEQLLDFAAGMQDSLETVFVVMGEPASSGFLAQRIRDYLGIKSIVPAAGDKASINF